MEAIITNLREKEWITSALTDDILLKNGLAEIGLSEEIIKKCSQQLAESKIKQEQEILIRQYNDGRYSSYRNDERHSRFKNADLSNFDKDLLSFKIKKRGYANWTDGEYATNYFELLSTELKRILGFLDLRIEKEELKEIKIPLFKFNSPQCKGSMVVYENTNTQRIKNAYDISILGTGLGTTKSLSLSFTHSFTSCDGVYLLIFAPVTIKNSLIGVYERGKRTRKILRTEWVIDESSKVIDNIGCEELSREEFLQSIDPVKSLRKYPLSKAPSNSNPTYKILLNGSEEFNYQVGINAFNLSGNCKANISKSRDVKLEFKLPPGHDYQVNTIMNDNGILWN